MLSDDAGSEASEGAAGLGVDAYTVQRLGVDAYTQLRRCQKKVQQLEREVEREHSERQLEREQSDQTLAALEEELKKATAVDQNDAAVADALEQLDKKDLLIDGARQEKIAAYEAMQRAEEKLMQNKKIEAKERARLESNVNRLVGHLSGRNTSSFPCRRDRHRHASTPVHHHKSTTHVTETERHYLDCLCMLVGTRSTKRKPTVRYAFQFRFEDQGEA